MKEKTIQHINPRFLFTIPIDGRDYHVYDIEQKEHQGPNGEPKTWWIYHGIFPANCGSMDPNDENWIPYHYSMERLSWSISFVQKNTSKPKWNSTSFSNTTWCQMHCNGKLVYEFGTHGGSKGMSFAMAKAQYMQAILCEHPYDFLNPSSNEGRKIWWHGLPATVSVRSERTWEIIIKPDYGDMPQQQWWDQLWERTKDDREDHEETQASGYIVWGDAFEDGNIKWYRNER
jgi:hypothetical protein